MRPAGGGGRGRGGVSGGERWFPVCAAASEVEKARAEGRGRGEARRMRGSWSNGGRRGANLRGGRPKSVTCTGASAGWRASRTLARYIARPAQPPTANLEQPSARRSPPSTAPIALARQRPRTRPRPAASRSNCCSTRSRREPSPAASLQLGLARPLQLDDRTRARPTYASAPARPGRPLPQVHTEASPLAATP